jgi:hypothetical protein
MKRAQREHTWDLRLFSTFEQLGLLKK